MSKLVKIGKRDSRFIERKEVLTSLIEQKNKQDLIELMTGKVS